jgi:hypothetical protein
MTTKFRFRLTSSTRLPGLLRVPERETTTTLSDGRTLFIVARDAETLESAKRLHFEAGGYDSEQAAKDSGHRLRIRLQILNAALSLGLTIPIKDEVASSVAKFIKDKNRKEHGLEIMDDVAGVLAFPDDGRHAEYSMHVEEDFNPSDSLYWIDGIGKLWESPITLDDDSEDALRLLGQASIEESPRNAFLLTYLALETLIPTSKRSAPGIALIRCFERLVDRAAARKHNPLDASEKDALRGALGHLHQESFRSALLRVARLNPGHQIEGQPILEFVRECSDARNATAHPKRSKAFDYAKLVKGLRLIAMGVLWSKHGIPDLTVSIPPSRVAIPAGALQARTITYDRQ